MAKASKKKKTIPTKQQKAGIDVKRAKAYADMESSVCDIANMGELAMDCMDDPKFTFAVGHLEWMLKRFKERYYAMEFPPEN
jgi:hypothetical protein